MQHRPHHLVLIAVLLSPMVLPGQELALTGLDPIDLARGEERAGAADLELPLGRFRYRFATADNLATFRAEPERHAIQFGGACARMGPLSGAGDPARWLVHDGRIYVFASDQCRDGFRNQPARFLDADVPRPPGDPAGAALLARAVAAHGGGDRLRAWRTYAHEHRRVEGDTTQVWRLRIAFPERWRTEHDYLQAKQQWHFANVVTADAAFSVVQDKTEPMHQSARREATHQLLRDPVVALRRALDRPHAATAVGKTKVGGTAVDRCELWLDGAVVTLGVGADGRVLTLSCRARGPQLWFGALDLAFDDFESHDGILVPHRVRATFDGKPAPTLDEARQEVAVDAPVDDDQFRAAK